MGWVYEGIDERTGDPAAIKLLSAKLSDEEGFRQRFEAEIEVLKKLNHPNIVQLIGFGQEGDLLFYAMELVPGSSLEEELRSGRVFHWRDVILIGLQVCQALRHAHDRGVIHRDIKPANLLRTPEGKVKLSDFGIARLFGMAGLTAAGNVLGTIEYMAPEQAEGRRIDVRSDLYSLGAVLYALLAGHPPFRGDSIWQVLEKKRTRAPEPLRRFNAEIPRELEAIILQLLALDPEKRIATATALSRRLEETLRSVMERHSKPTVSISGGSSTGAPAPTEHSTAEISPSLDQSPTQPLPTVAIPPVGWQSEGQTDLPETKPTSAFRGFGEEGLPGVQDAAPPAEAKRSTSQFVVVRREELDRLEAKQVQAAPLISPYTWLLAAGLIALGAVIWYTLQPPSADQLYERVMRQAEAGGTEALLAVESDIEQFLLRFPEDTRCEKLQTYRTEIQLYRLERQFERGLRGQLELGKLLPVERAYLEAIGYMRVDPELAIEKLKALIALYGPAQDPAGPAGKCLELARRRLLRLLEELEKNLPDTKTTLSERLAKARELAETDLTRAREIWSAIVALYCSKPWASAYVAEAERMLAQTTHSQTEKTEPNSRPTRAESGPENAASSP